MAPIRICKDSFPCAAAFLTETMTFHPGNYHTLVVTPYMGLDRAKSGKASLFIGVYQPACLVGPARSFSNSSLRAFKSRSGNPIAGI